MPHVLRNPRSELAHNAQHRRLDMIPVMGWLVVRERLRERFPDAGVGRA